MNRVQTHRSSVAGARPIGRAPGELFVNFVDGVFGYVDAAGQPIDLKTSAVTCADIAPATPKVGDLWFDSVGGQLYVWYDDGSSQQWVIVVNNHPDLAGYMPITGGDFTGPITGTDATFGGAVWAQTLIANNSVGTNRALVGQTDGSSRWAVIVGDTTAETGGNSGSNFKIVSFDDAGVGLTTPMTITRATGHVVFHVDATSTVYPQVNGTALVARALSGATNLSQRWALALGTAEPESGGGAGSNFAIYNYNDFGGFVGQPLNINRFTQTCTFSQPIVNGSDRRLKEAIEPIADALQTIQALQGVTYNVIGDATGKRQVGLVAQDVEPILPEVVFEGGPQMVAGESGEPVAKDNTPMLGVSYGNIVAVLIEAVKELKAEIDALKGAR